MEPKSIFDIRRSQKGKEPDVLVHWKGLSPYEDTWELISVLENRYPSFHLEDKVSSL